LVFEQPLPAAQRSGLERLPGLMMVHRFELHDIAPTGERVTQIAVAAHVREIAVSIDPPHPDRVLTRFTVNSKQDRDVLVWTSSLMFQYVHYHIARIATINAAAHAMDWEAQQDPGAPERVKRWVEQGQSRIERLYKTNASC